ncbi:OLC1v1038621C1 [Oldenlandia corymbosa var. corymbosa]|uniref:OLC1v1038621C1 n=1 Tax=Oldenlandia corymbosa var. corymbosa TaxID=529605 RepID=A0AAV1D3A5_OLDCO|nr:OLC1v1038621C1 [Oldenlandia corymbosa var. corymbosa]
MIPLASTLPSQIRHLLRSLNGSNSDHVFEEIIQFTKYGVEGNILILQACLDHLNVYERDLKNGQLDPVFRLVFIYFLDKPNFSTVFCESLKSKFNEDVLNNLSNALSLTACERIATGLALSDSENIDIRMCGKNFCMAQIVELCTSQTSVDSADQIQQILMFLNKSEGLSKHIDAFMQRLSLVQLEEEAQFLLAPLFPDELFEANFFRSDADDFDAFLAEMEKEMSMADVMKELGYGCTASVPQCKEILSMFLPLTEVTIARMLGTVTRTYAGLEDNQNVLSTFRSALGSSNASEIPSLSSWNANALVDSIKELAPEINWTVVVENLDYEGFYIPNEAAFSFLMSIYNLACQEPFPLHAVCRSVWMNAEGQLSFIKYAVVAPPEVFTFAHSERQLAYLDVVNGHKFQPGHSNHAWLCIDLLEVLCQLAERGHATTVRSILEYPLKQCPEILLLGVAKVNTAYNLIQKEVASVLFPIVIKNPSGNSILHNLWHVNPGLLLWGFADAINTDQENVTRVLESCLELKILPQVLDMIPSCSAIRLVAVASRRESIDLEKWVSNNLTTYKDAFYEECLRFLKEVQLGAQEASGNRFQHSGALWNVLQANPGVLSSSHLSEELEKLHVSYKHANSRPRNGVGADSSASDGYADDIESEANSYFHQMFSGQLTIDDMIQMLSRFKESPEKREQSIFECMIANLFEEYKFFSKYPERQLKIAAILFGSLIKHQLVTHLTLGIALRGVLDALRKPADSKMFVFGTKALEQFVERMIEWPQYCNHILQISHLRVSHPELVAFIERALVRISATHSESDAVQGAPNDQHGSMQTSGTSVEVSSSSFSMVGSGSTQQGLQVSSTLLPQRSQFSQDERKPLAIVTSYLKPVAPSGGQSVPLGSDTSSIAKSQLVSNALAQHSSSGVARAVRSQRFGSALNIETLVAAAERRDTQIEVPASEVQDKISFIINNLSAANVEAKAKEFTEILQEQFYPWFAQYMVMKRASIEPNFHDLYLKFLDKVNSRALHKEIVQATYENCKVLLGSELIKSSSEERSLLKNLGSWLGKITIGRNQVLRAREIDPKSLIMEAYEKGLMIAVIPFTSKVLEPCQSSIAYQPPNPWTMGILGLLAEIYAMPNLKMNLKFDIEVLFKTLGVDLKDVPPTSLLKARVREVEGNPDFSIKDAASSQQIGGEVKVPPINKVDLPPDVPGQVHPAAHPRVLTQFAQPGTPEDDKVLPAVGLPDQLPPSSLLPGPSPFSVSQLNAPPSNIEQLIVVNPKLHNLSLHVQRILPMAIDQAVKEIVSNIKQRSVSIATQTTKELVLKDYAMETDETRILTAAHLMVASLAGSLAHVTCKEPLRASISSQLRSSLQVLNVSSDLLEQAVLIVTNDNVDLGCAMIEQAATEKALQTIDGEMAHQLAIRRKQREAVGPGYFESTLYIGGLPEALRPKPGRLSHSQQRVYEDFVRLPWQNQSSLSSTAVPVGPSSTSVSGSVSRLTSGQMSTAMYPMGTISSGTVSGQPPLGFTPDELDTSLTQTQSTSTAHVGIGDMVSPQSPETENLAASFPAVPAEPQLSEPVNVAKEPGIAQSSVPERPGSSAPEPLFNTGDVLEKYQIISEKLENLLATDAKESEIQGLIAEVPTIILRCLERDAAALAVAQKAFKALYENASNMAHVSAHLAILAAIRDVSKLVVKELTSWVVYSEEDRKFNKDITVGLIRSELLNLAEYNVQMAKFLDGGRNKAATEFAISLIQTLLINDSRVVSELHNLVAARPGSPESLQQLVEIAKNPATANNLPGVSSIGKDDGSGLGREKKGTGPPAVIREEYNGGTDPVEPDPAGFREQVQMLFKDWYRLCEIPGVNDAACAHYILQLHQNGLLKGDDTSDRFFRLLTELSVSHCLSSEAKGAAPAQSHPGQPLSFLAIDIYAKLVYSVLKFCPVDQSPSKLYLLSKVLAVTVKFIQKDAEEKKTSFNSRPYFRLFLNWILDLCSLDPSFDGANFQVLTALANAFHALQPLKVPGFSFVWLELVSHRSFMPKLLTGNGQKGWPHIQRLLVDLFQFMEPFLRNAELTEPIHFLYKGTLRVLLVLLHDFPEFLCDYHFSFCDVIPPSCIQMRNIILSAFPRNMRLPDPSTPNLKIDLLAEISQSPRILSDVDGALKLKLMKNDIDEYLKTRPQGSPFLSELKQKLLLSPSDAARAGTRYNAPLINSLVLYVGQQAIQQLQARTPPSGQSMASSVPLAVFLVGAALDIFQALIVDLDTEGRYLFLNAAANQLRYPNNHTHYFSFVLLYLFAESNQEMIQEQITRVLLERLIVNRPHPWGLLITFIELIKNPRYNFWSRGFTRCAPEIEKLFESVSRSCGGPKPVEDGGIPDNMH